MLAKVISLVGFLLLSVAAAPAASPAASASYDYIVIGAGSLTSKLSHDHLIHFGSALGTAGAALASRLAEDKSVTVLLLEAGEDTVNQNLLSFVPGADVIGVGWWPK